MGAVGMGAVGMGAVGSGRAQAWPSARDTERVSERDRDAKRYGQRVRETYQQTGQTEQERDTPAIAGEGRQFRWLVWAGLHKAQTPDPTDGDVRASVERVSKKESADGDGRGRMETGEGTGANAA